jgi:hypothetical protein
MRWVLVIEVRSVLAGEAAEVWRVATTGEGINFELQPVLRMTAPRGRDLDLATIRPPVRLGRSWLLLLGVLPIDADDLNIDSIDADGPVYGFRERSTMLTLRRWHHDRTVAPVSEGRCAIIDRIAFEPRVPGTGGLLLPVVRALFRHRHRRLRQRWGAA